MLLPSFVLPTPSSQSKDRKHLQDRGKPWQVFESELCSLASFSALLLDASLCLPLARSESLVISIPLSDIVGSLSWALAAGALSSTAPSSRLTSCLCKCLSVSKSLSHKAFPPVACSIFERSHSVTSEQGRQVLLSTLKLSSSAAAASLKQLFTSKH